MKCPTCGNDHATVEPTLWHVSTKGYESDVSARCQLEAYDLCLRNKSEEWWLGQGWLCTANLVENPEDGMIAIHTQALCLRYGHESLARWLDGIVEEVLGEGMLPKYEAKPGWVLS